MMTVMRIKFEDQSGNKICMKPCYAVDAFINFISTSFVNQSGNFAFYAKSLRSFIKFRIRDEKNKSNEWRPWGKILTM